MWNFLSVSTSQMLNLAAFFLRFDQKESVITTGAAFGLVASVLTWTLSGRSMGYSPSDEDLDDGTGLSSLSMRTSSVSLLLFALPNLECAVPDLPALASVFVACEEGVSSDLKSLWLVENINRR